MTQDYTSEIEVVSEALNAVYENKQVNKKNDISGDYSSDNASYPTVKAVKALLNSDFLTATEINTLLSSYALSSSLPTDVSELTDSTGIIPTATSDLTDDVGFVHVSDIKDNLTSTDTNKPLSANQGKELKALIDNKDLSSKTVTLTKLATATSGYLATYELEQGGVSLGKIDIPKDIFLQDASLETVGSTPTSAELSANLTTGDLYIKLIVNTTNSENGATILCIPVNSLIDDYGADNVTIQISNGVFSVKTGGIGTTQLADGSVTSDKIATSVKNTWLTDTDVKAEISAFANALADAINPSSP